MIKIIIKQHGEVKKTFEHEESDFVAFKWLLNHQGQSTDYALRWDGWTVQVINEVTGESEFWKPYSV